jgi:hypothetical protein
MLHCNMTAWAHQRSVNPITQEIPQC